MSIHTRPSRKWLAGITAAALLLGLGLSLTQVHRAFAGDGLSLGTNDIIRVEEDWALLITQPDPNRASPQVSTQMARAPWAPRFCNFHLNSCDVPTYTQGGLQMQVWRGTTNLDVQNSTNRSIMSTDNELITWTQYIRVDGSQLKFGIASGAVSQTWGDFGGLEMLINGGLTDLSEYDPDFSHLNSGVTFGANRVSSLIMLANRKYREDGSVETDDTPRIVFVAAPDLGQ